MIGAYLAHLESKKYNESLSDKTTRSDSTSSLPDVIIDEVGLNDKNGRPLGTAAQFQLLGLRVKTRRYGTPIKGHMAVGLKKPDGQLIFFTPCSNCPFRRRDVVTEDWPSQAGHS